MVVAHKPRLTYEDYRKTPEGARYELLNGRYAVAGVYGKEDILASPVLPGFALDLSEAFEQTNKD